MFPARQFNDVYFETGDLLVVHKPSIQPINPGHVAIVVKIGRYGQLFVWELDTTRKKETLQPLYRYIQCKNMNSQVFRIPLQTTGDRRIDSKKFLRLLQKYKSVKYQNSVLMDHLNQMFHELTRFPRVPRLTSQYKKNHFYCTEVIFYIFIDCGIFHPNILQVCKDQIIKPDSLLCGFNLNNFTPHNVIFGQPHLLTLN